MLVIDYMKVNWQMGINFRAQEQKTFSDLGYNTAFFNNTKPGVINNSADNQTKMKSALEADTLDKSDDNKKQKLIKGGIIAGVIALAVAGFFMLRGKGTEKATQAGENAVDAITARVNGTGGTPRTEKTAEELTKTVRKAMDEIDNPKLIEHWYKTTPVSFDETSVEKDVTKWIKRFEKAPRESSVIHNREHVKLNNPVDIKELSSIKPHDYTNISEIFVDTRTLHGGFPDGFAIVDGKFGEMSASYNDYVDYALGKGSGDYGYRAGISKDGRACVELHFKEKRQDEAGRICHTRILLRSKDGNFTQDQLDAIKMFQNINEEKIAIESPIGAAFMLEEEGSKNSTSLFFNKNMFLSIIKNEADKYKNFDVQGLLTKGNAGRDIDEYAMLKKRVAVNK